MGDAREIAIQLLARIERSGYGTPKPDRFTPTFWPDEVRVLAEFVLSEAATSLAGDQV